jgi:hypothetical protein
VSAPGAPRLVSLRTGPRRFLALLCTLLLGVCLFAIVRDARERQLWAVVAPAGVPAGKRPALWETANVIESNPEAALVVAETLLDSPGTDPRASSTARQLILDGIEARPGSAHARFLLGRSAALGGAVANWAKPLELAAAAAPGLDFAPGELARRYLASWSSLSPSERRRAETSLRQAFRDTAFLDAALSEAVAALGPEGTVRVLPDDAVVLGLAARFLREKGSTGASELVAARLRALPPAKSSRTNP